MKIYISEVDINGKGINEWKSDLKVSRYETQYLDKHRQTAISEHFGIHARWVPEARGNFGHIVGKNGKKLTDRVLVIFGGEAYGVGSTSWIESV